ncbi:IST1-like protein [Bienertia sinuspersici]
MGKTLDILLGKRSSKLNNLLELSITRNSYLKNRQQALFSFSQSDVVQLLNLGHQQQALLRVEHVIKSKNMLDALALIESYCKFLKENMSLIEKSKDCPEEVREAIGSMIFASSRIGDNPKLQHIRAFFASKYGQDFVTQAIENPRNLGVNDKIIQKLSRRQPSLESRMSFLREIASNNGIILHNLNANLQQQS